MSNIKKRVELTILKPAYGFKVKMKNITWDWYAVLIANTVKKQGFISKLKQL